MKNSNKFLFLASGVKNDEGFWFIGVNNTDENILEDEYLVDFHRKELIGNESANDILFAINLNLNNLLEELRRENYMIDKPSLGISFDMPLEILENIYDFWLDTYREGTDWETCIGLLKTRKRLSLLNLINNNGLKGKSKNLAKKIETLHSYRPLSAKKILSKKPMWK